MALRTVAAGAALGAFAAFRTSEPAQCRKSTVPAPKPTDPIFDFTYKPFKLGKVINLTSDTAIFRFLLPNADDVFDLQPISTLQAFYQEGMGGFDQCQRCYTPITANGEKGYFDLIVKKQKQGRMTEHLFSMKVGDSLQFRAFHYKFDFDPEKWKAIGLIGGGSGITPLLQIIRGSLARSPTTKLDLLFGNRSEDNILLKGSLDELAEQSNGLFTPHYTVDHVNREWKGMTGIIDAAKIKKTMPPPGPNMRLFVCGPDKFMSNICGTPVFVAAQWSRSNPLQPFAAIGHSNAQDLGGVLKDLGYNSDMVYRF